VVLLDDLDTSHSMLGHYLKQWADKFPFQAETKGSTQFSIRPEHIIVTSNYTPDEIWGKDEEETLVGAIKDRFKVIDATKWQVRRSDDNNNRWDKLAARLAGPQWINGIEQFPEGYLDK